MGEIRKKILTDEQMQPVAVQIDYEDWLQIEKLLNLNGGGQVTDLSHFRGVVVNWEEDAVEYQRRIREEWER